jgi:FAD/FMN-containing dehydrogenase
MPASPAFFEALSRALPGDAVTRDPGELVEYGRDWTRVVEPAPCAVAMPRTTAEVVTIVRLAAEHGVAVVPSGGRTGLAGGAVAAKGELVLSLSRMRAMHPVDTLGGTVRVQAGAVTQAVHEHAAPSGLTWPVDFASKGSSTVGGNIATNAGGVKVIRWGVTRPWVLGLEVVLASAEVLHVGGALEKNNTGLDLRQLFIGSEGTLGVVTEATLKLAKLPARADVLPSARPAPRRSCCRRTRCSRASAWRASWPTGSSGRRSTLRRATTSWSSSRTRRERPSRRGSRGSSSGAS